VALPQHARLKGGGLCREVALSAGRVLNAASTFKQSPNWNYCFFGLSNAILPSMVAIYNSSRSQSSWL
jgi:hypothetical protein